MDYENDYVILVDENGQPYLAHSAVGDKIRGAMSTINRKVRNNVGKGNRYNYKEHKYLEKVPNYFPNGRALYLYTQDEVDAFHGRNGNKKGSRTLSNRIRDRLGFDERIERDEARAAKSSSRQGRSSEAGDALNSAQERYNKTALGRLENFGAGVRNTTLKAIRGAKNAGRKVGQAIDDLGIDEYARLQKAKKSGNSRMLDNAQYEWANSTLGKATSGTRRTLSKAGDAVGRGASTVGTAASNAARNVGTSVSGAVKKAGESVKETKQGVSNSINNFIDSHITGSSANASRQQAQQAALMGLDNAIGQFVDANDDYQKSLAGRTEGARGALNSAVSKANETRLAAQASVLSAWNRVRGMFSKDDAAALQAELNANMGLDGSIGEWFDTHK